MPEKWETLVIRDIIAPNLKVFQALGYWPPENASSSVLKAYKVYGVVFAVFYLFLCMVSEIMYLYLNYNDLEKVIEGSFLLLTHLVAVVKLYHFVTKHKRIVKLINLLQNKSFRARNESQYRIIKNKMLKGLISFYAFITMAMFTCFLWGIAPIFDANEDGKLNLPLRVYYPFNTEESPIFEIIYVYQIVGSAIIAAANICLDTTISSIMCVICSELQMMNDTLLNLKPFAVERLKKSGIEVETREAGKLEDHAATSPEVEYVMTTIMVECVRQHWLILHFTNELGDCFNIGILAQFAASSIIICVSMFQMTLIDLFSIQFVSMVTYQICMFVEVFLYCWFGNEIILTSENICTSIYSSDWYRNSLAYKKNMLMIMTRTHVPIQMYAGNLLVLSLATFAAILKSSWSYFAVLQTLDANNEDL